MKIEDIQNMVDSLESPVSIKPIENIYINQIHINKIKAKIDSAATVYGIKVIADETIPENEFIVCTEESYRYYQHFLRLGYSYEDIVKLMSNK